MKVHNLQQNSSEWLEFRRARIGASDIPIILGQSPYTTISQLYMQKKGGSTKAGTWAQNQGHKFEEQMANTLCLRTGIPTVPAVATHDRYDWLMASFDGIDIDRTVLAEFKYNSAKNHTYAKENNKPCLPHWLQMQAQLMVAELPKAYYVSFNEKLKDTVICEVFADVIQQKTILKEAKAFKKRLDENRPPISEVKERQDADYVFLTDVYRNAKLAYTAAETALKKAREKLFEQVKEPCRGNGYEITPFQRKGTIAYDKIPELEGVDIDKYRNPMMVTWTVREKTANLESE